MAQDWDDGMPGNGCGHDGSIYGEGAGGRGARDKVVQMSKFKVIVNQAKAVITGEPYEPYAYLTEQTIIRLLQGSDIYRATSDLKGNSTHVQYTWDIRNGTVHGLTMTAFSKPERQEREQVRSKGSDVGGSGGGWHTEPDEGA